MLKQTFYIPSYNALVYCHEIKDQQLILGGLNKFFGETIKDNSRQAISKADFKKLEPLEINGDFISEYEFIEYAPQEEDFQVKNYRIVFYLEEAVALPSAPFKKIASSEKSIEEGNKKNTTAQGSLFS